ncbi:MAG: ABC transporter permease [Microbacteriaceae bacterium]
MGFWAYLASRADDLAEETLGHVLLVLAGVGIGALIAFVVGVLVARSDTAGGIAMVLGSVIFTIPSLAIIGLLMPVLGLGWAPSVAALACYSGVPVLRNTIVGLREVPEAQRDAAAAMGMSRLDVLRRIELPIAWPMILAGIRVAVQLSVGIAALAAFVNGPGLGSRIFDGLTRIGSVNALNDALAATLLIAVVALILDAGFVLLRRATVSKGLRANAG